MKYLLSILVALALTAGVAALVLHALRGSYFPRELSYAAGVTMVSATLAMVPILLTRHAGPVANFQAAFGGTIIHLFLTLAMGAAAYALQWVGDRQTYIFLLLGFYWFSLVFVVIAMIKLFRRSIPQQQQSPAGGAGAAGPVAKGA